MLTPENEVEIHALAACGWNQSAISRHTGRDRKTSVDVVDLHDYCAAVSRCAADLPNRAVSMRSDAVGIGSPRHAILSRWVGRR